MSIGTTVFLLLFAFIAGGVVGAFLNQRVGPSSTQRKQLEEQLKQARKELSDYQAEVTDTFAETAKRVNKLTASYKDVHDHLAQSAIKLTSPAVGQQFLETNASENQASDDATAAPDSDNENTANDSPVDDTMHKDGTEPENDRVNTSGEVNKPSDSNIPDSKPEHGTTKNPATETEKA